jgi:hypothetical protein
MGVAAAAFILTPAAIDGYGGWIAAGLGMGFWAQYHLFIFA